MPNEFHYECMVLGAGPAGSTTAALVAEAGHDTLLVDRAKFPRDHVGESLMPETFWTLQRLGVLDRLRREGFVRKVGVQFVGATGHHSQPFLFKQHDPRECVKTFHVERSHFDHVLFENAAAKGAEARDQTRVLSVDVTQVPNRVRLRTSDGEELDVTADVIADATGQQSLLANHLGLKVDRADLHKASIWGYFEGGERGVSDEEELTTILHSAGKQAWFWYIPLAKGIVSVGLVSESDYLFKKNQAETIFEEEIARCPGLERRLNGAKLIGELEMAREFSYTTSQHAGDGWVLVGDAYGFVDPVYSTGVFLALRSGELAADAIVRALENDNVTSEQLGGWTTDFDEGVQRFTALVKAFYTKQFSFANFLQQYPQHIGNLTDLLIGRAFTDAAAQLSVDLNQAVDAAAAQDVTESSNLP